MQYILISIVATTSCVDPIDLEVPKGGASESIYVDGKLVVGDPSSILVSINEIFDFDGVPNRLSVLRVELLNEAGVSVQLDQDDAKFYSKEFDSTEDFIVSDNESYMLRITMSNQDVIESAWEGMKSVPRNNSLKTEFEVIGRETVEGVNTEILEMSLITSTTIPNDANVRLRWNVDRTFKMSNYALDGQLSQRNSFCNNSTRSGDICALLRKNPTLEESIFDCDGDGVSNAIECDIGTDPNSFDNHRESYNQVVSCYVKGQEARSSFLILDPSVKANEGGFLDQKIHSQLVDFRFYEGVLYEVVTESLTNEVYEYFDKINQTVNRTGSFFDRPVGRVVGNMNNITEPATDVFGYFYVTETDTSRVFIENEEVDLTAKFCLLSFVNFAGIWVRELEIQRVPPEICDNCTLWAGEDQEVSVIKPEHWPS